MCSGDVRVNSRANPQYLEVHIKVSKTDPWSVGSFLELMPPPCDKCEQFSITWSFVVQGLVLSLFSLMELI